MISIKKNKWKNLGCRGMLLLEAILATVILAVSISIIIESLVSALRAATLTGNYSRALLLADDKISGLLVEKSASSEEGDFPEPDDKYHFRLVMEDLSDQTLKTLKQPHLTISWNSGRKKEDVSVTTWIFKLPSQNESSPNAP